MMKPSFAPTREAEAFAVSVAPHSGTLLQSHHPSPHPTEHHTINPPNPQNMHILCRRLAGLANTIVDGGLDGLIKDIEKLGALAVQSQKEAFERYVTLLTNLRNTIEIDHDSIEVQNSETEEMLEEVGDVRNRIEGWCISRSRGPNQCAGFQQAGGFCNNAPVESTRYCDKHIAQSSQCLYAVELSEVHYSRDVRCYRSVGSTESGTAIIFCDKHFDEIDSVVKSITDQLEDSRACLQLVLEQVKYFFRQNPLSRPAGPSEIPEVDICTICLETLNTSHGTQQAHKLLCGHFFHGGEVDSDACLSGFFRASDEFGTFMNSSCPLCRHPVFANGKLNKEGPFLAPATAVDTTEAPTSANDVEACSDDCKASQDEQVSCYQHEAEDADQSSESSDERTMKEYGRSDDEQSEPEADDQERYSDEPEIRDEEEEEHVRLSSAYIDSTINVLTLGAIDGFMVDAGLIANDDDSDVDKTG